MESTAKNNKQYDTPNSGLLSCNPHIFPTQQFQDKMSYAKTNVILPTGSSSSKSSSTPVAQEQAQIDVYNTHFMNASGSSSWCNTSSNSTNKSREGERTNYGTITEQVSNPLSFNHQNINSYLSNRHTLPQHQQIHETNYQYNDCEDLKMYDNIHNPFSEKLEYKKDETVDQNYTYHEMKLDRNMELCPSSNYEYITTASEINEKFANDIQTESETACLTTVIRPDKIKDEESENQREMTNARERQRTQALNDAYDLLRDVLPITTKEKLSKIETLKTATKYIKFLKQILRSNLNEDGDSDVENKGNSLFVTYSLYFYICSIFNFVSHIIFLGVKLVAEFS